MADLTHSPEADSHAEQLAAGDRFAFGENWAKFVQELNPAKLSAAQSSICSLTGNSDLTGVRFLDMGSGSGLFSLGAAQLGAQVVSVDYDPISVACTSKLRERYGYSDSQWTASRGSVLDTAFLNELGSFDIVYSWGVLHHTGSMWNAIENVCRLVRPRGVLAIAIYNDQGRASQRWLQVKRAYNALPRPLRWLVLGPAAVRLLGPTMLRAAARGELMDWQRRYAATSRGMSIWRDTVDWVGGLPFEVASPEAVFDFVRHSGFSLEQLKTCGGGHGCNEFAFRRN